MWEETISAAQIPLPEHSNDPKMQLYVEQMQKNFPNSSYQGNAQWGWGAAQVLVEGIKRAGDELTWDNFIAALETLDKRDGSLYKSVTFSPDNHYGITTMFITQAKDGSIVPISGDITFDPVTKEIIYEDE